VRIQNLKRFQVRLPAGRRDRELLPDLTGATVGQNGFFGLCRAEKCLFGTDKQFRGVDKPFGGTLGHLISRFDDDGAGELHVVGIAR